MKYYRIEFRSNNSDINIVEVTEVDDLRAAIERAKTILTILNSTAGIPNDFRVKSVIYSGEVPTPPP